jgi:tetratricopeptide (TPR) repeat protein
VDARICSRAPRAGASLLAIALVLDACAATPPITSAPPPSVAPATPIATPSSTVTAPAATIPTSPTVAEIDGLRQRLAAAPDDQGASRDLGFALLQRARETLDPGLYVAADEAFGKADPTDPLVTLGKATLAAARHEFRRALDGARATLKQLPDLPTAHAIEVDALVELGRYDEADAVLMRLAHAPPTLPILARASYLRELRGDLPGAIDRMREALAAADPDGPPENVAYVTTLLGDLLAKHGDIDGARQAYDDALRVAPDHVAALLGEGRLALRRNDLEGAIQEYQHAVDIVPTPEAVVALGEAEQVAGKEQQAADTFALAGIEIQLLKSNGVTVDLELGRFEADHGDPKDALASAERAYHERRTIHTADLLGWARFRTGDLHGARKASDEALRLGTPDPLLRYHAGAIAAALGDAPRAREQLTEALRLDPGFSATGAADARRLLDELAG